MEGALMENAWQSCSLAGGACWLWPKKAASRRRNIIALFRLELTPEEFTGETVLEITADSRYELHVNGERLGGGPPRSWPEPWPMDSYPLEQYEGRRLVIAVRVRYFGRDTYQYIRAAPGLFVQFREGASVRAVPPDRWRCRFDPRTGWPAPRMCSQLEWEEQIDARLSPVDGGGRGWMDAHFEGEGWEAPGATSATAALAPHRRMVHRDIPPLSCERASPPRFIEHARVAHAAAYYHLDLREMLAPENLDENPIVGCALIVGHIHAGRPVTIWLVDPHQSRELRFKARGDVLELSSDHPFAGGVATPVRLERGWNMLRVKVVSPTMAGRMSIALHSEEPLAIKPVPSPEGPDGFSLLGPAKEPRQPVSWGGGIQACPTYPAQTRCEPGQIEEWWGRRELDASVLARSVSVGTEFLARQDAFASILSARVVGDLAWSAGEAFPMFLDPVAAGESNRLLFDFGEELLGEVEFEISCSAGTVIEWMGFEHIQHDGRRNYTEGASNSLRYVAREGRQRFRSSIRRGFRFCYLCIHNTDAARLHALDAWRIAYPQAGGGDFTCSDPSLNRVWETGLRSLSCCSEDTYTDCPAYEQAHWVGDARMEAMVDLVVNGDGRLSRHCWLQAAQSLQRSPMVESVVPGGWRVLIPTFSWLWVDWAVWHFRLTGDMATGRVMLEAIGRQWTQLEPYWGENGLLDFPAWNLLDWAPMDTPGDRPVFHVHALMGWAYRRSAELADHLGEGALSRQWSARADAILRKAVETFWDASAEAFSDALDASGRPGDVHSHQSQIVAIMTGVSPEKGEWDIEGRLRMDWSDGRAGSPFFGAMALQTLYRWGKDESALQRIREFWCPQIEAGATTFWEMYQPWKARLTRSHCHGWGAIPCFFFLTEVLGVSPAEPGFRSVRIAPKPGRLRSARGVVPTPDGPIAVEWEHAGDVFRLRYEGPPNRDYIILFPAGYHCPEAGEKPDGGGMHTRDHCRVLTATSSVEPCLIS